MSQTNEICEQVKKIYDWLDSQLAETADKCTACGNCCDFARFGHKLFITSPELLYFKTNIGDLTPIPLNNCDCCTRVSAAGINGCKPLDAQVIIPFGIKPMPAGVCPYMQDKKCTARDFRFAGCRIFFCKADEEFQSKLSEQAIKDFKQICDKYQLPYRYTDLKTALNNITI
ncbi:MAG: hypothetical protein WC770_06540 [Phycisphaerae bacterium]|jgi:hypothetical protein